MAVELSLTRKGLLDEARCLVERLRRGHMRSTAYDTAWVARLAARTNNGPYDLAVEWLLAQQHSDGSWGGRVFLLADRVVCTLAAVTALAISRERRPEVASPIAAGVEFLNARLNDLDGETVETGAYELLVPSLCDEVRSMNVGLRARLPERVMTLRAEKLRGIPPAAMYSPQASFVHNLEVLGDGLIPELARPIQSADGSFGSSPSATAYFLTRAESPEADSYLAEVMEVSGDGGAGNVYPFDIFEHAWVLWNLRSLRTELPEHGRLLSHLAGAWRPGGVGFSSHCHIVESDDTAVAFRVLRDHGLNVDPSVFRLFEADDFFYGFPFERGQSVTANAHVLEAMRGLEPTPEVERFQRKAISYLERSQRDGHWRDKWHISPLYATSQAVVALRGYRDDLVARAVDWLYASQHPSGAWGLGEGTDEETAYAVNALLEVRAVASARSSDWPGAVERACAFLAGRLAFEGYPELWIGKALYVPQLVVRSAILGALDRYLLATDPGQGHQERTSGRGGSGADPQAGSPSSI